MTSQHNTAEIRKNLKKVFDDTDLSAFSLDYFPELYDEFSQGMRKGDKITLLLDHCSRQPTGFQTLLDAVKNEYKLSNGQREELCPLIDALERYIKPLPTQPPTNGGSEVTSPVPFIYGRPVRGDEFLNRRAELRTIFNRIRNCESTVVSGEPHIGKTSLLLQLANKRRQREYLGHQAERFVFVNLDLLHIAGNYNPVIFWEKVLKRLFKPLRDHAIASSLKEVVTAGYDSDSLEELFEDMEEEGLRLVLLLDEFECLLTHPNFKDPAFFALLRSLATRTGALAIVPASRLSVAEMNQQGRRLLQTGSPFFNNTIEVRLGPFDEHIVGLLLDRAGFDEPERAFIRRVAGRQPFLLQAMAATLLESPDHDDHAGAAKRFYKRIAFHFDDLWYYLDDRTRTTAVILSLLELGGQLYGKHFNVGKIERADRFEHELRRLADLGLAAQVETGISFDSPEILVSPNGRWTMAVQALAWWVRDVVIAQARQIATYDQWLHHQCYRFLVTQAQWERLVKVISNAPPGAGHGVGELTSDSHHLGHNSNYMPSFPERAELVEHLLLIPSIADRDRRSTVIEQLRSEIKRNIRHSEVDQTYVFNIVNTCLQYKNGMQNLRDILQVFEGDSIPMQRFDEALNRLLSRGSGTFTP